MRMNKSEIKKLENVINEKANIGMMSILGDKTLTCVDTMEDSYGTRYIFDDGLGFTKSNILSNIINCESKDLNWYIQ